MWHSDLLTFSYFTSYQNQFVWSTMREKKKKRFTDQTYMRNYR